MNNLGRLGKMLSIPLLFLWGGYVVTNYLWYHSLDWEQIKTAVHFFDRTFIVLAVAYLGWVAYRYFAQDKKNLELTITPIIAILVGFFLTFYYYVFFFFENYNIHYVIKGGQVVMENGQPVTLNFVTAIVSFFTKITPNLFIFAFLALVAAVLGRVALRKLKMLSEDVLEAFVTSSAVGYAGLILAFFFIAWMGLHTTVVAYIFLLGLLGVFWQDTWFWLQKCVLHPIRLDWKFFDVRTLCVFILLTIFAFNTIFLLRMIPIGWDDIGVYMNSAKLLAGYGELIGGRAPYNWEIIMSLGFLLTGQASAAMYISFMAGIYAVLALYLFGRQFWSAKIGLIAATAYYSMPMVQHFSFADMKIDNALFFFAVVTLWYAFHWFTKDETAPEADSEEAIEEVPPEKPKGVLYENRYLFMAAFLIGIGVGIKLTTLFLFFAISILLAYHFWSWSGMFAAFFLEIFVLGKMSFLPLADVVQADQVGIFLWVAFAMGVILLIQSMLTHKKQLRSVVTIFMLVVAFVALPVIPWGVKNGIESGSMEFGKLLLGKNLKLPKITAEDAGVDSSQCQATALQEEIYRYIGREGGIERHFLLPWRLTMNTMISGTYVNIGYLFLLFLPLLLCFLPQIYEKRRSRYLFFFMVFYFLAWLFMARGIPWYGLAGYAAYTIFIPILVYRYLPEMVRTVGVIFLMGGIVFVFAYRVSDAGLRQRAAIFNYIYGKYTENELFNAVLPNFNDIARIVANGKEKYPDRYYLYRVGTFVPYFIPNNDYYVATNDPQIDFFKCLLGPENDDALVAERLKKLGFRYMIVDLYTASIEKEGNSLHKKLKRLNDFLATDHVRTLYKHPGYQFVEIL